MKGHYKKKNEVDRSRRRGRHKSRWNKGINDLVEQRFSRFKGSEMGQTMDGLIM